MELASAGALAAVAGGAALQSAVGFGFALVASPVLVGIEGSERAVGTLFVLGALLSVLTLALEQRRPVPDRPLTVALTAWSLPGLALGALALRLAPRALLEALVAVGVVAAATARLLPGQAAALHLDRRTAGVLSGTFGASTGLSGPPLVLHLLGEPDREPAVTRDTLAAVFLATDVLGFAVLAVGGALAVASGWASLLVAVLVGQLVGRTAFGRLSPTWFTRLGLGVLLVSGALTLGLLV